MSGRRLSVAVVVGLVGLTAPAGAAAAANSPWSYFVTSASGSAAWHYSGPNGGGLDSVTFQARPRRLSSLLRGSATYTDKSTEGCGPVTKTKRQNYSAPSFSVQGNQVEVTWRFPLPSRSYCDGAAASNMAQQLQGSLLFAKVPLSRFNCNTLSVVLAGAARLSQGGITGTLSYQATVVLQRRTVVLSL
jgi:hypothetical protein